MGHGRDVPEQALRLLEQLTTVLRGRDRRLLEVWPLTRYMACLDRYPRIAALEYRSREVQGACAAISSAVGDAGLDLYHRTLLLALLVRATRALPHRGLPEDIELLYERTCPDRPRYRIEPGTPHAVLVSTRLRSARTWRSAPFG